MFWADACVDAGADACVDAGADACVSTGVLVPPRRRATNGTARYFTGVIW
jgi:hypothetical protein